MENNALQNQIPSRMDGKRLQNKLKNRVKFDVVPDSMMKATYEIAKALRNS